MYTCSGLACLVCRSWALPLLHVGLKVRGPLAVANDAVTGERKAIIMPQCWQGTRAMTGAARDAVKGHQGSEVNTVGRSVGMTRRSGRVQAAVGVLGYGSDEVQSGGSRDRERLMGLCENENLDEKHRIHTVNEACQKLCT